MKIFISYCRLCFLAGLLLFASSLSSLAGTGYIQGQLKASPAGSTLAVGAMVEALNATNAICTASAVVNSDDSFELKLPEGEYRLCFRFAASPGVFSDRRSFYDAAAEKALLLCFSEGTVVEIGNAAVTPVLARVGYDLDLAEPVTTPIKIAGTVFDGATAQPLPGITVELLDTCSVNAVSSVITDSAGGFYMGKSVPGSRWVLRFSDPSGRYGTSFHGSDSFDTSTSVDPDETLKKALYLRPQHIEVAPLAVDFGNVQLPGSAPAVVTIQNIGGADLHFSSLALVPGSSPNITILSAPVLPFVLAANASCEVALQFKPSALGQATATLLVASSDPDEAIVSVALSGAGVASEAPPAEQVATTIDFVEESVNEGTLQGTGPAGAADAHLHALLNQIKAASDLAAAGKLTQACQQLANAMQRTDGDSQPPDFVTGPAAEQLRLLIELTRLAIGCK